MESEIKEQVSDKKAESNSKLDLGERMKIYEAESLDIKKVEPYKSFLVRFDGRSFSKFTGGLIKPFDLNFTKAMVLTTIDLVTEFSAATGYTHSDEITIIFKGVCTEEEYKEGKNKANHIFDGRVIKLLTILSGFCSVRFNFHICNIINTVSELGHYKETYIQKIKQMKASFDSRLIVTPNDGEIVNHMIWRSIFDCERNAVSTFARAHFSQSDLQGKAKKELIEMLKEKGIDWYTDVPLLLRHGIYFKKMYYEIEVNNEKVVRTKVDAKAFKIKYNEFFINLLLDKLWNLSIDDIKQYEIEDLDLNYDFVNKF